MLRLKATRTSSLKLKTRQRRQLRAQPFQLRQTPLTKRAVWRLRGRRLRNARLHRLRSVTPPRCLGLPTRVRYLKPPPQTHPTRNRRPRRRKSLRLQPLLPRKLRPPSHLPLRSLKLQRRRGRTSRHVGRVARLTCLLSTATSLLSLAVSPPLLRKRLSPPRIRPRRLRPLRSPRPGQRRLRRRVLAPRDRQRH